MGKRCNNVQIMLKIGLRMWMKELANLSCERRRNEIKVGKDRVFEVGRKELKVLMLDTLKEI